MELTMKRLATVAALLSLSIGLTAYGQATDAPVTVTEDATSFTMSNGIVMAKIAKRSGDIT